MKILPFQLIALLFLFATNSRAQQLKEDTILKTNGETIICHVNSITESDVIFSYPSESLTNTLSQKLISSIHFGSGRIQSFSKMVVIHGEEDWQKVQLTTLESDVQGLSKKGEVKGKAGGTAMSNMTHVKERAEEQIKREAAKLGAFIVLVQEYNVVNSQPGINYGKANINGVAYGY